MTAQMPEPQPACFLSVRASPQGVGMRAAELEASIGRRATEPDAIDEEDSDPQPVEIDAGGLLVLLGTIECVPPCDLRGSTVAIIDQDGSVVGEAEIAEWDGAINATSELVVKSPLGAGTHEWRAAVPAHATDGVAYDEASTSFSIIVKAHQVSVVVWDVPSAIAAGETFRFKVGVKCSSDCSLTGWLFEIQDEHGGQMAEGALGGQPWPGTTALYYAEVQARAPTVEGLHDWMVDVPGLTSGIPHQGHKARFGVRAVRQPECVVTIEAIDRASQMPIKGAKVVIHPYRAFTDGSGRTQVRVPRGAYRIFVSGTQHLPYRAEHQIHDDLSVRAELIVDRAPTDADLWS
jgi:hypothetical protein